MTIASLLGLPASGPLRGLAWLARQVAEAAEREARDPARIERELLALEQALEAGTLSAEAFEAREAELLALLEEMGPERGRDA